MEKDSNFDDIIPLIKNVLDNCFNYAFESLPTNSIVDLGVFLFFLKREDIDLQKFPNLISKIDKCLKNIRPSINTLIGKLLPLDDSNDSKSPDFNSGLAILFPEDQGEIDDIRIAFINRKELHPDFFKRTGYLKLIKEMVGIT